MTESTHHHICARARGDAGFTLMEMLIAIALMGIVLSALAGITAQWVPNWNRGLARVQRNELVDIALSRLVADIGAAEFVSSNRKAIKPLFEGTELSIIFVRSALGPNTKAGLEVVRIAETADRAGLALVRSRAPFTPTDVNAPAPLPPAFSDPVVLLRAPFRLSFAYAGHDGGWRNAWSEDRAMPTSVRFTVRNAASDRILAISTAAIVHVDMPAQCVNAKKNPECEAFAGTTSGPAQPDAAASQQAAAKRE
jgi:general secretion pathway protein J